MFYIVFMNNRLTEHFEGPDEEPDYKKHISQLSLLYTGGRAYQAEFFRTGTGSISPANPHTFLGVEYFEPSSVRFRFHNPATQSVVEVSGPIDRCAVRVMGAERGSLEITIAQGGGTWYVDRPILDSLPQLLTPPETN